MHRARPFLIAVLLASAFLPASPALALPEGWGTDHKGALAEAAESVRPILVVFGAGWCPHCKRFEETTLKDPEIQALANRFVRLALDYDEHAYLVAKFGLRGVPSTLMLDPDGRRVATLNGFASPKAFQEWVGRHAGEASPELAADLGRTADAAASALATALDSGSDADIREILAPLFERCLDQDEKAVADAQGRAAETAASRPGALVPLLLDENLMIRIIVANALASDSVEGGPIDVDPWGPEPERRKAVELWKRHPRNP
ncbi:hypothetical protein BH23VER1_BH23VER1_01120 [soil metagenome]